MEYTILNDFKYKNNTYTILKDNYNKLFFLKNNQGKYSYVTLEEYIVFLKKFIHFNHDIYNIQDDKQNKKKKKLKIIPKIIIGTTSVIVSLSLVTIISTQVRFNKTKEITYANYLTSEQAYEQTYEEIVRTASINTEDKEDTFNVDYYQKNDYSDVIYIYDLEYLDEYFPNKVTKNTLLTTLEENNYISNKFKELIKDYINNVYEKYPNIDGRVFNENLKTLKIEELEKDELIVKSLSFETLACYSKSQNTIYTLKDYTYEKGTFNYQIIFHELSHAFRLGEFKTSDNKKLIVNSQSPAIESVLLDEMLNTCFSVSVLGYEERDIAYQLASNYMTIILECMDNYSLEDYITHSNSYFIKKLDEFNGDNNRAASMIKMIEIQRNDYNDNTISVDEEQYYPLYEYISNIYYKKYITIETSYDEAIQIAHELYNKITYDVPNCQIKEDKFIENAIEYLSQLTTTETNQLKK